jgi:(S)-citramalyl-CoA lyase
MDISYLNTSILKFNEELVDPSFGSDALIIDLEDSVHISQKDLARQMLLTININNLRKNLSLGIRINQINTIEGIRDINMIYSVIENKKLKINFIQIPKIRSEQDIVFCKEIFSNLPYKIKMIPIVETTEGINEIEKIAIHSDAMMFGQVDMNASMYQPNKAFMAYARGRFCAACFKEGIPAIDTAVFNKEEDIRNEDHFEQSCFEGKAEGFMAKAVVHPNQIQIVKKVFGISKKELEEYSSTIEYYKNTDKGFSIVNGAIIAPPFVSRAGMILKLYQEKNEIDLSNHL